MNSAVEPDQYPERGDWWNFERLSRWDPTHPAAAWAADLLQDAALIRLPCPRCRRVAPVRDNLDHLLRDHRGAYVEAATWLEEADADLFSLAVHYLATKERASRSSERGSEGRAVHPHALKRRHPVEAERRAGHRLLPGWCSSPSP